MFYFVALVGLGSTWTLIGVSFYRHHKYVLDSFASAASATGFEARKITPKPAVNVIDTAQRSVPILSSFARGIQGLSVPGMFGVREGIAISVWLTQANPRTMHYLASIEVEGPPFIIRKGSFRGAIPGDYVLGSKEPSIAEVGGADFLWAFTVRSDDELATNQFMTKDRQQAIMALRESWSNIEITNHSIELQTNERFSGDPDDTNKRVGEIAALATLLSS